MKRKATGWMIGLCGLLAAGSVGAQMQYVQVRDGALRSAPSFLGGVVGPVAYGDAVTVVAERGPWRQVTTAAQQGWLHESALTRTRVVLSAGAQDVDAAATHDELALAGKGFTQQVEDQTRRENPQLDYARVDWMERLKQPPERLAQFLERGGVRPQEGAL